MSPAEVDAFLADERTCRVATIGADRRLHVVPLWFVWHGGSIWLNSLVKSQRWTNLRHNPALAVVVDAGEAFSELRGVEINGEAEIVGDTPRTTAPCTDLDGPERLFAQKYAGRDQFVPDGRHAWLRVVPDQMKSWDFRKNPALRA